MASAHSRQATPTTVFVLGCFVAFLNFFLYYTSRLDLPKNWHFKNEFTSNRGTFDILLPYSLLPGPLYTVQNS